MPSRTDRRRGGHSPVPRRFATPARFRAWLARFHASKSELIVRCFRADSRALGMTYPQALDEALCHGWIDGVRHSLDAVSFTVRFTPRTPRSIWSNVNIGKVRALQAEGRMAGPGLRAFAARDPARSGVYSFERETLELAAPFTNRFRKRARAWRHFQAQPPGYRKTSVYWVMSARQPSTRERRFQILLDCSAEGTRIPLLRRTPPDPD